jgi:vesicle-fusing ATPase
MRLQPVQSPDKSLTYSNICAVSQDDIRPSPDGNDVHLLLNGQFVLNARPLPGFPRGQISLNEIQRTWMRIAVTDVVEVELFDPFRQGGAQSYLGAMDIEIGYAGTKAPAGVPPFDQDELADAVTKVFRNQIFAPGQSFLLDFRGPKLKLTVRTVELVDLASLKSAGGAQQTQPQARGILIPETVINFFKDAK